MGASGTPIFKTAAANATGVTVDLGQQVAGVALRNDGPDTVFWAVGGTPPSPTKGDGRCSLDVNKSISLAGLSISELSFICATAETATVQIAAVPQGEAVLEDVAAAAGAGGFFVSTNIGPAFGPSPTEYIKPCAVDVNGALWAIATLASSVLYPNGILSYALRTYLQFDGGAWQSAGSMLISTESIQSNITFVPIPVDCSGKLQLTGIKCVATHLGKTISFIGHPSLGSVLVMGIGQAVTPL